MSKTTRKISSILTEKKEEGTKPFDSTAEVVRVEGETVWVHMPGGVDETPARKTINAKEGDIVQVRVANGSAWLVGNASAPPTDDVTALRALNAANIAEMASTEALRSSESARESAEQAQATANEVRSIAEQAQADAEAASTAAAEADSKATAAGTAAAAAQSSADSAAAAASAADTKATNAATAAAEAQSSATAAGTAAAAAQTQAEAATTAAGTAGRAAAVAQAAAEAAQGDIDDLQEWFWHDTNGSHVLGATSGYRNDISSTGMEIVETATEETVAKFGAAGATIGKTDETRAEIDYHSLQLVDKEGNPYFYVSDLRGEDGLATITETFTGDGSTKTFTVQLNVTQEVSAADSSHSANTVTRIDSDYTFSIAPNDGATVRIVYKTNSNAAKAYTLGSRAQPPVSSGIVGPYSFVEGEYGTASGRSSHCEGYTNIAAGMAAHAEGHECSASGDNSHAEGLATNASGMGSHAQNLGTIAGYDAQTAIGKNNDNKQNNAFEIGNGTGTNRSNALELDWSGNLLTAGDITDGSGNVLSDKVDASSLAAVATSGDYSDLTGAPNLAAVATSGAYSDLTGTPNLAPVATSGSYNDLTNKPSNATTSAAGFMSAADKTKLDKFNFASGMTRLNYGDAANTAQVWHWGNTTNKVGVGAYNNTDAARYNLLARESSLLLGKDNTNVWTISGIEGNIDINNNEYKAGDTIPLSKVICAGFVTNSTKSLDFQIPLPKDTTGRTATLNLNASSGLSVRTGSGGYLNGTQYINTSSGYTITVETNASGLTCRITGTSAFTNVSNNEACSLALNGSITFS